ncbi:hypothetical protein [Mucilaginibacter oryzae]|nr:hypothetical protein [Mucilaginibacter oryzae]
MSASALFEVETIAGKIALRNAADMLLVDQIVNDIPVRRWSVY